VSRGRAGIDGFEVRLLGQDDRMKADEIDHPRDDDRNEQVDEPPAPDPEATDPRAGDDPEAD
jgi:hypothetical protein